MGGGQSNSERVLDGGVKATASNTMLDTCQACNCFSTTIRIGCWCITA